MTKNIDPKNIDDTFAEAIALHTAFVQTASPDRASQVYRTQIATHLKRHLFTLAGMLSDFEEQSLDRLYPTTPSNNDEKETAKQRRSAASGDR